MKRSQLQRQLNASDSEYRRAKRALSEKYLGLPVRGKGIKLVRIAQDIISNIVGIGVAEKRCDRRPQGAPAITFYVKQKLPRSRLTRRLLLPRQLDGLTCDVVACGMVVPASGQSPREPQLPLRPGAQIQVLSGDPGTLGGFVRDGDGDVCLITNCHVLSPDLATGLGTDVVQPAFGYDGTRAVATVKKIIPIHADRANRADVALARLNESTGFDSAIPGIGQVSGTGIAEADAEVAKFGQFSELTTSFIDSVDTDVVVNYGFIEATFRGVHVVAGGRFASDGDSGSVVVDRDSLGSLGIVFATSRTRNFVIPTSSISDALPGLTWL